MGPLHETGDRPAARRCRGKSCQLGTIGSACVSSWLVVGIAKVVGIQEYDDGTTRPSAQVDHRQIKLTARPEDDV
jgi:hypothetical protein